MTLIPGRLGLQQRVLPNYRAPFFDLLAASCSGGLGVFAGQARPEESIEEARRLQTAVLTAARNRHILSGRFYFCWQSGLKRWLESWQPEVLVMEANPRYLSSPGAVRWMHSRSRPVIGWGLGAPASGGAFSGLRSTSWRRFISSFDALIAYSRRGAQEYIQAGADSSRVFVAPNAAAPRPVEPPPSRPAVFSGKPVVLFVGRLQARKRIDLLLQACARLDPSIQPELWIVGDGPARAEMAAQAAAFYPQARFLGALHGPDLAPIYRQADLFVLPGTGGLAVQQAMAHALPVMVAEADGTGQDLVRPENGWVLPPANLDALTAALRAALSDPASLRQRGAHSYQIVAEEINLENMVAVFARAVQTVLHQ